MSSDQANPTSPPESTNGSVKETAKATASDLTVDSIGEPLDAALDVIGDRWTLLIVHRLLTGPGRFNELMAEVAGIAPNILTKRLRHLETNGIIVARAYSQKPVRLQYELTAAGNDLGLTVQNLRAWGLARGGRRSARHVCGTELETRPWCPHCEAVVDPTEIVAVDVAVIEDDLARTRGGPAVELVDWV
jgi:DNA-binding HxlR family transcriptional regulator